MLLTIMLTLTSNVQRIFSVFHKKSRSKFNQRINNTNINNSRDTNTLLRLLG